MTEVARPDLNYDLMKLEQYPRIAVYTPQSKLPWDDAVTLVLTYTEIPYDIVFDEEVLHGDLIKYDWIHLHHEDFTGQYGKFYAAYRDFDWYKTEKAAQEAMAAKMGFAKVWQ